ncbi:unnamed protein product [Caretta caretta]
MNGFSEQESTSSLKYYRNCLEETHTDPTAKDSWRLEWGDGVDFSHFTIRQAGVAALFSPNLRPKAQWWWDLGKVRAKLFCRDYSRSTSRRRNAAIEQLEREVLEMERRLAASPEDPFICAVCREKRKELRALEDHQARGAFVRSRIHLLWEMDRGSRFFYALEKTRGAKKHITCLLAEDGAPLTDPVEMCGRACDFYMSLFSPDPTNPGACRVLWEELPMVSVGD